ncbi:Rpn family recombination-promoting nuclease/putative transposase [Escherichia coli]|nr:Rpn family recombination-promoting nuclease/putative transposase [Escherichia coli]EJZ1701990.1 Rpn family recombination-promoting nuclease/putative transposase [Escherichia coli]MGJ21507.1 Rpn family recombination-promoting nuclease/putative transposase [Escherichia coli]
MTVSSRKKDKNTPTQHDAAFRAFMASPEVARDFVELHLPEEYRQLCDVSTLRLEPCTFVDQDLKQYACDALFSMKTVSGEDGYIYCLVEHQSTENAFMAFRMLRYAVAAMQRHFEQYRELPLVIPLLFYHGERSPYPYSMNWLDCFRNPELAAKIYTRPFHLVDVTVMDDDEIVHHRRLGALTLLMKHSRSRDLMMQMDRLVQLIQDSLNEELAQVLFHYLLNGSEHVTLTFLQTLAQRLPRHEDNIMTLAEQLKQSGREEGIALGLAQGIEQGVERGKLETARNMLNAGIARKMVLELTGLSEDQLKMLKH